MVVLLALAKIGVVAALINCNLTDEGLSHSINIAKCRGCVYQHKLENVLAQVATNLKAPIDKSPFQVCIISNSSFMYLFHSNFLEYQFQIRTSVVNKKMFYIS